MGRDGVITVEENQSIETVLNVVEGLQFDRGYLSPYFITDTEKLKCVLEDCFVLVVEKKISALHELMTVLEEVAQQGKPLLVIAEDVEGEAPGHPGGQQAAGHARPAWRSRRPASATAARPCSTTSPSSPGPRRS